MPTYEYICDDCGYEFEEFQAISESPIETCPKCSGHTRRKITGGAGFVLKGSGFYTTDYRSESYKKEKDKEAAPVIKSADTTKKDTGKTAAKKNDK